jgi:NADP-dependent 3-hydroxy acid dehydrogenase YdfG
MSNTLLVCGYGPGISEAVARLFGAKGYKVAIVARTADKLNAAVARLKESNVDAAAYPADLSDPAAVASVVAQARKDLGPISVVHWNAYAGGAGDLVTANVDDLRKTLDVAVTGLVSAVQASHADLKANKGSVLITGGGLSTYDPNVDAMAVSWNAMGLAISKAAQHKTAGLLAARLTADGIYVGEVVVTGLVKGTAFDSGHATLEASSIAQKFWDLLQARAPHSVRIP